MRTLWLANGLCFRNFPVANLFALLCTMCFGAFNKTYQFKLVKLSIRTGHLRGISRRCLQNYDYLICFYTIFCLCRGNNLVFIPFALIEIEAVTEKPIYIAHTYRRQCKCIYTFIWIVILLATLGVSLLSLASLARKRILLHMAAQCNFVRPVLPEGK